MKPYKCKGCRKELFQITGTRIVCGAAEWECHAAWGFACQSCGHKQALKRADLAPAPNVDYDQLQRLGDGLQRTRIVVKDLQTA